MNHSISILLAGFLFCGCAHLEKTPPANRPPVEDEKLETRNNAASLLADLLGQEKNVGKILIIKRNSAELGGLIKAVSETAAAGEKQLKEMAAGDPELNLLAIELPSGEKKTRAAVAKTEEGELLFSSGQEFEFNLLLTQAEALSYGWHLAKIAAENSPRPAEAQKFNAMSADMKNLCGRVVAQMRQDK